MPDMNAPGGTETILVAENGARALDVADVHTFVRYVLDNKGE